MGVKQTRIKDSDTTFNVVGGIIFALALLGALYPLLWMAMNSFRSNDELFSNPLALPQKFDITVFGQAWQRAGLGDAFRNSVLNSLGAVLVTVVISSPAAFALSRIRFAGGALILRILMATVLVSGQVILLPLFFVMRDLRLYDTLWSTIIGDAALYIPLSTTLFYNFYRELPVEIEEATRVDGCGRWSFYTRFVLPLSKSILSSVIIFTSLWSWNEYLYALTFLKSVSVRTFPVQLRNFFGEYRIE